MRAKALARVRALPRKALTLLTWSVPSLLLFGVTTYVIVTNVLDVFHDNDSLKWTVIAAVLTGAALLVGLIGRLLPSTNSSASTATSRAQ
jgi:hypothetical protein